VSGPSYKLVNGSSRTGRVGISSGSVQRLSDCPVPGALAELGHVLAVPLESASERSSGSSRPIRRSQRCLEQSAAGEKFFKRGSYRPAWSGRDRLPGLLMANARTTMATPSMAVAAGRGQGVSADGFRDGPRLAQVSIDTVENDHGRLKVRPRPIRGIKRCRPARILATGHALVQNLRSR
jgi:hypothetical protein